MTEIKIETDQRGQKMILLTDEPRSFSTRRRA